MWKWNKLQVLAT